MKDPLYESIKCLEAEEKGWGSTVSDYISARLCVFRFPDFQISRLQEAMMSDHSEMIR